MGVKGKENIMKTKVNATITKETEKAYQLTVEYWPSDTTPIKTASMWVPKSQCTIEDGRVTEVEDWILGQWVAKHNEFMKKAGYSNHRNSVHFDMAEYENIKATKKAKQAAFEAELNETLAVTAEFVKPYADDYMQELAWDARFICDNYKDSDIIANETKAALAEIAAEITKEFGIKAESGNWWDSFVEKHATFESVRDFLWHEVGERCGVYGVNLYDFRIMCQIKLNNGLRVSESMLRQAIGGTVRPEDTLLAKKFKKNWAIYKKFYSIVDAMFNH